MCQLVPRVLSGFMTPAQWRAWELGLEGLDLGLSGRTFFYGVS
jgi:hypothetical protein